MRRLTGGACTDTRSLGQGPPTQKENSCVSKKRKEAQRCLSPFRCDAGCFRLVIRGVDAQNTPPVGRVGTDATSCGPASPRRWGAGSLLRSGASRLRFLRPNLYPGLNVLLLQVRLSVSLHRLPFRSHRRCWIQAATTPACQTNRGRRPTAVTRSHGAEDGAAGCPAVGTASPREYPPPVRQTRRRR